MSLVMSERFICPFLDNYLIYLEDSIYAHEVMSDVVTPILHNPFLITEFTLLKTCLCNTVGFL